MKEEVYQMNELKKENLKCIGCLCTAYSQMQKKVMGEKKEEMNVKLCEEFNLNEEIIVREGVTMIILDIGAPFSLAGKHWMTQYLGDFNLKLKNMMASYCHQVLWIGPS